MSPQPPVQIYQLCIYLKQWFGGGFLSQTTRVLLIFMQSSKQLSYRFDIWGKEYGIAYDGGISFQDNPRNVFLKDFSFWVNEKFVYEYNFVDQWEHQIRLEKKVPITNKKISPYCLSGNYTTPREDCGGPCSFMKLKKLSSC